MNALSQKILKSAPSAAHRDMYDTDAKNHLRNASAVEETTAH